MTVPLACAKALADSIDVTNENNFIALELVLEDFPGLKSEVQVLFDQFDLLEN